MPPTPADRPPGTPTGEPGEPLDGPGSGSFPGRDGLASDPRLAEVLEIVSRETGIERDRLCPEAGIAELGIASLDLVQAIFAIEQRFGVDIPVVADQPGGEFATVGDLLRHVRDTLDRAPQPLAGSLAPGGAAGS